eukprot:2443655-Pyramimonas_sp.AAC.1
MGHPLYLRRFKQRLYMGGVAGAAASAGGRLFGVSAQLRAAWLCWSASRRNGPSASRLSAVELVEMPSPSAGGIGLRSALRPIAAGQSFFAASKPHGHSP